MNVSPRCLRAPESRPAPVVVLSIKPLGEVWLVREAHASTGEVYDRKEDALARARHILTRRGGGILRILGRTGAIERELELRRTSAPVGHASAADAPRSPGVRATRLG